MTDKHDVNMDLYPTGLVKLINLLSSVIMIYNDNTVFLRDYLKLEHFR